MPDTRPGITFDKDGVCCACRNYEARKNIDWKKRMDEFKVLCDKYRGCNGPGGYDCAVAVSGGKDSHFQVHMLKEVMGLNPILFSVEDNFPRTEAGQHNLQNISEEFGCTIISCKPNIKVQKTLMRKFFEEYGKPTWYFDRLIYTFPLHRAAKFNTALLIGDGAVVGAASVVTKDVPPYAIVAGVPARIIRYRFDEGTVKRLLASRRWDYPEEFIATRLKFDDVEQCLDVLERNRHLVGKERSE